MRYPQEKIKEAVLHPDIDIREQAVRYFAAAFSPDSSIMPLVIKAVETFGRQNEAYRIVGLSSDLMQTEDTIAWVIDELNAEQTGTFENYAYNLSMVLVNADPALLLPRESDILAARHFFAELRETFTYRLRLLSWDEAACWQRLEEFSEEVQDKRHVTDDKLSDAKLVVEALARYADACGPKIREWLTIKVDDYRHDPMEWLEPLVVRLAGLARMESTIPLIVGKLLEDGSDLLNEECAEALIRIGTPSALHAIAEEFPTAAQHFRIYATTPLEHIQSDLAVDITLKLLDREEDSYICCQLAHALLGQFAHEGIEAARKLVLDRELNFSEKDLQNYLLKTCTLTGERFPEYDEWLAAEKKAKEEHRRWMKEVEADPDGMVLRVLEKLAGKQAPDLPKPKPSLAPVSSLALPRPAVKQKIGRNDPCPWRSGKKYKNCCMRK